MSFPALLCDLCGNCAASAVEGFVVLLLLSSVLSSQTRRLCGSDILVRDAAKPLSQTRVSARHDVPPEVRYKSGYVNLSRKPPDFTSTMLWGIAIADTRVPGHQNGVVEIAHTQFTCRADSRDFVLNNDRGSVRGGLYSRFPWFGTDAHDPMPLVRSDGRTSVILRVGTRPDRVWHFWAASPRRPLPSGDLDGCTVKMHVKVSQGALLQVGFDYWRNSTVGYQNGGNNHEAGASGWYFASPEWQEATFSDLPR